MLGKDEDERRLRVISLRPACFGGLNRVAPHSRERGLGRGECNSPEKLAKKQCLRWKKLYYLVSQLILVNNKV